MALHFSKSFAVFICKTQETNKISKILYRIWVLKNTAFCNRENLVTTKNINYLTNRQDGTISYLPAGKECVYSSEGTWSKQNRQNGKPAKVIRKLFTDRFLQYFSDADFEAFANQYKSNFCTDGYAFEIRKGSGIADVYTMCYEDGEGSLNNSCMRNESRNTFDIYTNCKQCSILALFNNMGELAGRALLWKVDGKNILDRIYVSKEHFYEHFLDYARKEGFWFKKDYKSYDNKTEFINPETEERENLELRIETETNFGRYPYIDTFTYGGDGWLTNDEDSSYNYAYKCTGGEREDGSEEDDNSIWVERDGTSYHCYDVTFVDRGRYRNEYLHSSNVVEIDGENWWEDDDEVFIVEGNYYTAECEEIVYSEHENEYILRNKAFECNFGNGWYFKYDSVEIDGKLYFEDAEGLKVDLFGNYQLEDNCYEFVDCLGVTYWVKHELCFDHKYETYHLHPTLAKDTSHTKFAIAPINFIPTI